MMTLDSIIKAIQAYPSMKTLKFEAMIKQNTQILEAMKLYDLNLQDIRYYLKNNLPFERHTCNVCGKTIHYNSKISGFPKTCSRSCSAKDPDKREKISNTKKSQDHIAIAEKRKQTNLLKYGTEFPQTLTQFKQKQQQTNLLKYGKRFVFQSDIVKAKIKNTNLKRYGVENPATSDLIKQKTADTCIKKYGFKSSALNPEVAEKRKTTNIQRYGVENPINNEEIRNKVKATNQKKYSVDFPFQSKEIQNKVCESNLINHGSKCSLLDPNVKVIADRTLIELFGDNWRNVFAERASKTKLNYSYTQIKDHAIDANLEFLCDSKQFKGKGYSNIYKWKCLKCGTVFESYFINGKFPLCPECNKSIISSFQLSVLNFIKSICPNINYKLNIRKIISPFELDIYFPKLKIAIETNGDYWHSTYCHPDSRYHALKTSLCEEKGIHLIHIFEHEWIHNQDKIKMRLINLFGGNRNSKVIYARKCEVRNISYKIANAFLDKFHSQNHVTCSTALGLYYKEELVAVMTFGKPRFNKKYEWELLRFASAVPVIGGASKLLKHFEKENNPKNIISYANRCWSNSENNVYLKIGFKLIGKSEPSYWYVKDHQAFSRFMCQKSKLKYILSHIDESKSEEWNMLNNGYLKIYDCGNLIFEKLYT